MNRYFFLLVLLSFSFSLMGQISDPDKIVGIWKTPGEDVLVKIDKIGKHYQGRIVWLNPSITGVKAFDVNNPNDQLKDMPLKGIKLIEQLSHNPTSDTWEGGTFYNHLEGRLYNCRVLHVEENQLRILQYIQQAEDGMAETWTRQ